MSTPPEARTLQVPSANEGHLPTTVAGSAGGVESLGARDDGPFLLFLNEERKRKDRNPPKSPVGGRDTPVKVELESLDFYFGA